MSSMNSIVFFGGRAYASEIIVHSSMPISEAMKGMDEMSEAKFTFMPHGEVSCAGFARFEERRFFLMYFPPKRRQLIWKNKHSDERKTFVLWWPHVYLGIFFRGGAIEDGYAMCSTKKLQTVKDRLGRLPLPNLGKKYGHVCEGATGMWDVTARPEDSAYQYADYFFKSEWLSDINDHYGYLPKELYPSGWDFKNQGLPHENQIEDVNQKILQIWESISETDPRAIEKISWNLNFTIEELVQNEWKGKVLMDGHSQMTVEQIQGILNPPQIVPVTIGGAGATGFGIVGIQGAPGQPGQP